MRSAVGARHGAAARSRRRSGAGSRRRWSQRARLLNLILADLYGPQRLLRDGLLPPALVLANPASCGRATASRVPRGMLPAPARRRPGARRRTASGGCSPTARRRRRAPATRSRTASCCRAACPRRSATASVQRLASFFRAHARHARRRWRRGRRDNPRVVLLTPGPVQRDLLRARLPRALSRLHAGRGRRPDRARRARLHQDARRPAAGGRHPAPPRRRLLRSAGAARRLVARRRRPGARRCAPATSRSPTRSAPACSKRRRSCRSCPACAGTCSARS